MSFKPIVLELDGIFGQLPDGGIINAGGVTGPTFTVGGRGVLFDDGTSTLNPSVGLTLQDIYDNTPNVNGSATIVLDPGKNFLIKNSFENDFFVSISGDNKEVIINGDLTVTGETTTVETVVQDVDHWIISPANGATTALVIQPDLGFTPLVDLVSIRRTFGSPPIFRIDSGGNLIATQNLTVGGLINGVDVEAIAEQVETIDDQLQSHLNDEVGYRHEGIDIDIQPIANLPGATNVQEALEVLSVALNPQIGNVSGYQFVQSTPAVLWTINHNGNTTRVSVSVYDADDEQIIPERVKIVNINTVEISFTSEVAGSAAVLLF